ncbi:unnamed protein product, partial [Mesorhabditis spiculigera]
MSGNMSLIDWLTFARLPFIVLHHVFCIKYAFSKPQISPLIRVVLVIFMIDLVDIVPSFLHDFLGKYLEKQIFPDLLVDYIIITKAIRWYGTQALIVFIAFLQLWSIYNLTRLKEFSNTMLNISIAGILCFATVIAFPLLTDWAGFIFLIPGYYWSFDKSKPGTWIYEIWNWIAQIICLVFIIMADIYVIYFLHRHRRASRRQTLTGASSVHMHEPSQPSVRSGTKIQLTPQMRPTVPRKERLRIERGLAICFIIFSFGFVLETVSFNFLNSINSVYIRYVQLFANWLDYFKFSAYIFILRN